MAVPKARTVPGRETRRAPTAVGSVWLRPGLGWHGLGFAS